MCEKVVENEPYSLRFVPDQYKAQWMCERTIEEDSYNLKFVPDHFKTQKMCDDAVRDGLYSLQYVSDHFKTQEMCDKAVKDGPYSLQYVPDWFVTQQQIKIWRDDNEYWDNDDEDKFFEWYDGYKKRKAQKAQIKKELMPITWHPSRWWDWCMSEDEKKERKIMGVSISFFDRIQKKNFFFEVICILSINFNHCMTPMV